MKKIESKDGYTFVSNGKVVGKYIILADNDSEENYIEINDNELSEYEESLPDVSLDEAKREKIEEIERYDASEAVNSFEIDGVRIWLTTEQRASYKMSIDAAEVLGDETITLPVGAFRSVTINEARIMLAKVQRYADAAFIVTERHKKNILELSTTTEVEAYDYTTGYPEQLVL